MKTNVRLAKLVPWYYANKPRCAETTLAGTQCSFSASYIGVDKNRAKTLCKTHADMVKYPTVLIRPQAVLLGE